MEQDVDSQRQERYSAASEGWRFYVTAVTATNAVTAQSALVGFYQARTEAANEYRATPADP